MIRESWLEPGNKQKKFFLFHSVMVSQLISGSMLEKSNRTRSFTDRQKVLTARLGLFLFLDFQLPGNFYYPDFQLPGNYPEIFKKFPGNSGKRSESQKSSGFSGFGKFSESFRGIFSRLLILTFFDFQHFRLNFQHFVMLF